jgi:hypothetical protein
MTKKLLVAGLLTVASFGVGGLISDNALAASPCVGNYYTVVVDASNVSDVKLPKNKTDNDCKDASVVKISGAAGHLKDLNFGRNYGEKLDITVTMAADSSNVAALIKKLYNEELNAGTTISFAKDVNAILTSVNEKWLERYTYTAKAATLSYTSVYDVFEFVLRHPNVSVTTYTYNTTETVKSAKAADYADNVVLSDDGTVLTVDGNAIKDAIDARLNALLPKNKDKNLITKLVVNVKKGNSANAVAVVNDRTLIKNAKEIEINVTGNLDFSSLSTIALGKKEHVTLNVDGNLTIDASATANIDGYTINVDGTVTIKKLAKANDSDEDVWEKFVNFTRGRVDAEWYEVGGLNIKKGDLPIYQQELDSNTYIASEDIDVTVNGNKVVIEIEHDYDSKVEVLINNIKLKNSEYYLSEGSTIVELNSSYVATLDASVTHTVQINFTDGKIAKTQFTLAGTNGNNNGNGNTGGDNGGTSNDGTNSGGNDGDGGKGGVSDDEDGDKTPNTGVALSGDNSAAVVTSSADLTSAFGLISGVVGAIGISLRRFFRR